MQRSRPFILLWLALLMGLGTSALAYRWLERQPKVVEKVIGQPTEMVALAAIDLSWGTKLVAEMITLVPFPKGNIPAGSFSTPQGLEGRVLIANLKTNEPILESKLASRDVTTGGVSAVTHPEKRAMAVRVDDEVGVAGFLNPGDRVDVLVTLNNSPPVTKTVLQNMLVLASGTEVERKGNEQKPSLVQVITLEVSPEEGEKLALASSEGKLRMALRNQLNAESVLTKGATIPSLLNSYRLAEEKPRVVTRSRPKEDPPKELPPVKVEVIKGGRTSTVTFPE